MTTVDPFHESKQTLESARREYTSINSLTAATAFHPVHACDLTVRALYRVATAQPFPHEHFKPWHQPLRLIENLGLTAYYSRESQEFLRKVQGYAQDVARYDGTQAYVDYTKPKAADRAKELVNGAERFITETQSLASSSVVIDTVRKNAR